MQLRSLFSLAVVLAGLVPAIRAEPAAGEAEISAVSFRLTRPANGATDAWLEADVEVNARPAPDSPGQMLGRVRVTLVLGVEVVGAGPKRIEFYRASAEAVALGTGRSDVRFYLPPEIVRRDAARAEPRYWTAEATVGGRAMPPGRERFANALSSAETRRNFQQKAATAAAANDGILLPQHLTPFAFDYPNATPSFIRRE